MKTKKSFKKVVALGLCGALLASIGIGAYLTDSDVKQDVYTIGNVQAEIVSVGDMEVANAGYLLPNTIHQYERAATNTGINDAYVFMSITIPYKSVGIPDENGANSDANLKAMQLFVPGSAEGGYINSEWKLVDAGFIGSNEIVANGQAAGEHDAYSVKSISDITYVYGYVGDNADGTLKALASGETTSNLVDTMQLINLFTIADNMGEVSTKLYAIQTNHVNGGLTDVNGVWAVMNKSLSGVNSTHLVIEDGTITVADMAYTSNEVITSVYIPASVEGIGNGAFAMMPNLTSITIAEGSNLKTIGESAFYGDKQLTSFNLPEGVEHINGAFSESGLTSIVVPGSAHDNAWAFNDCYSLKSAVINEGVAKLNKGMFQNCTALEAVDIPASVTEIDGQVFKDCTSLKTINFAGTEAQWNAITFAESWNSGVPADCVINFLG